VIKDKTRKGCDKGEECVSMVRLDFTRQMGRHYCFQIMAFNGGRFPLFGRLVLKNVELFEIPHQTSDLT